MRIGLILCVYLSMKARLNLTIEEGVLARIKQYAEERNISISELVEQYFVQISKPARKSNLIELIESLPKPVISDDIDFKKQYFEDKASKYGF